MTIAIDIREELYHYLAERMAALEFETIDDAVCFMVEQHRQRTDKTIPRGKHGTTGKQREQHKAGHGIDLERITKYLSAPTPQEGDGE